jgi:hypothetical protein
MNDNGYLKYTLLERYLNRVKFLGIPIGATLADQFLLDELHGIQPVIKTIRDFFITCIWLFLGFFKKKALVLNTPVIGTWLADKRHLNNMVLPLIRSYKNDITVIYNPRINVEKKYDAVFISIKETFITPVRYTFVLFSLLFRVLFILFRKRKRLKLCNAEILYYSVQLFHHGKIISFYDDQFRKAKKLPRLVVTEYDRNSIASPLILTANKFGIKTVTLIHGVIEAKGFTPVLADYIFCFGEIQKRQLVEQHVPLQKIRVTGTSIIPTFKEIERINKQKETGLRVCLGISPIKQEHLDAMINTVVETVSFLSSVELIIKLHPSQNKEDFIHLSAQNKNVKILSSKEIDNIDLLGKIDLLIINFSGLGIEAMYQKVPVVLMKTHKEETGLVDLIVKWSTLPVFESSSELQSIISQIMIDSKYLDDLSRIGKVFADKYYFATGIEAAQNIVNELTEIANFPRVYHS